MLATSYVSGLQCSPNPIPKYTRAVSGERDYLQVAAHGNATESGFRFNLSI